MGKHLLSSKESTVEFQNNTQGCMWGILHILHYHHWHNVKKVLPHKKHHWGRHARYKRKSHNNSISEDQQLGDVDIKTLLVGQHSKKGSATGKNSTRSRKKGMHIENRSEEESSKGWTLSFHTRPQHLESSDKSAMGSSKLDRDVSSKFKEHTDVLEVFKAEKDLLLKFLRDLDGGGKSLQSKKARLTKSGSFPTAKSSQIRNINSRSTPKHKQNEIWVFPKGEKLLAGTQAPSIFGKDISSMKSGPLVSDHGADGSMKQNPVFSLSKPSQGLHHSGWNQLVLHRFKVMKQKIKHALMEFTRNGYQTSLEAIRHRPSSENRLRKEVSQSLLPAGLIDNRNSNETKASDYDSNKPNIHLIRRTSSLNESLDKYTQLFERSFGRDIKWHSSMSKSLKVTNEDRNQMSGYAPKLTKRNLSLPHIESISFILHEAICEANDAGVIPERTSLDNNKKADADILVYQKSVSFPINKYKPVDGVTEAEAQKEVENSKAERSLPPNLLPDLTVDKNDIHELANETGNSYQENVDIEMTVSHGKDVMEILEASYEDNATNNAEDNEENTGGSSMDEMDKALPKTESRYSLPEKETDESRDNYFLLFGSDVENDSNFKYVKHIIELSGFMENEHTEMWDTVNQPLKPSLFKEIECCGEDICKPDDHQLLFNIVNEVLLDIFEGSSTFFPRPFSFNLRLRPIPKGHYLLKEVWDRVNLYLSLRPELDQTLDDVVRRDLTSTGWMKLQWEEECVALELQDMIVDELLDEIIFS